MVALRIADEAAPRTGMLVVHCDICGHDILHPVTGWRVRCDCGETATLRQLRGVDCAEGGAGEALAFCDPT